MIVWLSNAVMRVVIAGCLIVGGWEIAMSRPASGLTLVVAGVAAYQARHYWSR